MTSTINDLVEQLYATRSRDWSHAIATVSTFLDEIASEVLDSGDRSRIDTSTHRIKSQPRTVAKIRRKLERSKGSPAPTSMEDVETLIGDIIGFKVLCKSTRDLRLFAEKLTERLDDRECACGLAEPLDDYVSSPKPTGYRAFHTVLLVPAGVSSTRDVKVEVQIKTRLQDAWGELTHEDMYKPGEAIQPTPFHESVARVMADMLASVDMLADRLAEDIEAQSKRIEDRSRASVAESEGSDTDQRSATVTRVEATYALAVDDRGLTGLIPARTIRRLAAAAGLISGDGFIDVDDYLEVEDVLSVAVELDDDATIFHPLSLPQRPLD